MDRKLTEKFRTLQLLKYKRKTGKGILDMIGINPMNVEELIPLIQLGNPHHDEDRVGDIISEEEACSILDSYFDKNPEASTLTAYFQLLDEYDMDRRDLRGMGISVEELKQSVMGEALKTASDLTSNLFDKAKQNEETAMPVMPTA